ncbi:MGMT family protein [Candidatus Pacearchaeota archaeon]|nr:MAG: MGMT family protein [Candidatus Pacearchaeota archaeon]
MAKKSFSSKAYSVLKKVPKGKVTTYKEIALALKTKAYRAVGRAMNKNKNAPKIPCHRVVKSNGEVGGYILGTKTKENLLRKEGIKIKNGKVSNFKEVLFKFNH